MIAERFLTAFVLSVAVTFGLFVLMASLIHLEDAELKPKPPVTIDMVHVIRTPDPEIQKPPPPRLKPAEPAPTIEPVVFSPEPGQSPGLIPNVRDPGDSLVHKGPGRSLDVPDGDAIPILRVPPAYPASAARRGIEGRVLVGFTIGTDGTVTDARVMAAEPEGIFDAAALTAVRAWRYEPKIVGGRPVEQRDLRIAIPFDLDASAAH